MSSALLGYEEHIPTPCQRWQVYVHDLILHESEPVPHQQDQRTAGTVHLLRNN